MDDWVRDGTEPPESKYPKIADKTLARHPANKPASAAPSGKRKRSAVRAGKRMQELTFPQIPVFGSVKEMSMRSLAAPPERVHDALRLDFGPEWKSRIITKQPPSVGRPFPALVPQVDEDGNDLGGVRLPQLEVPLATYTGWNLRDPKIGPA